MSRFPGQTLQLVQIQGTGANASISSGLLSGPVGGSEISTTVGSDDEVVLYEVSLYYFDANEHDFLGIRIYRDSTEIYNAFDGIANSGATMSAHFHTSFLDRPGAGTYIYSFRTQAQTANADTVQERTWVRLRRYYLPESISEITTNTFTLT